MPPIAARAPDRDTSIRTYRARRDFSRTHEPAPASHARKGKTAGGIFVVQKHDARRLHWDFRLEHGGVLWSWAVPKGPSLDPADKRLAVHVEDHPLEYADFSGEIPAGQYGAGTVEIWDRGTWMPQADPEAAMRSGELKFTLDGGRLKGGFVLVRLKPRPRERGENWLLIKEHDEAEQAGADAAALEQTPAPHPSAQESRRARAWFAGEKVTREKVARRAEPPAKGAKRATSPAVQAPELATLVDEPPEGPQWISEVKFDGYRLLASLQDGSVRLMTRNGLDWTKRLPSVAGAILELRAQGAVVDGELVALREDGVSDFGRLQAALKSSKPKTLHFYLFDLLHLDGWDLQACRLEDRKALLATLADWQGKLRFSDHIAGAAAQVRRKACAMGLEGIVCKHVDSPYRAGRSHDWLKVKCSGREEFVVLGWTAPRGSRNGIGALHLGFFDAEGCAHYAGGVGTGFSDTELKALRAKLDSLAENASRPLLYAGDPPPRGIQWVDPVLVVEVQFLGWSGAGKLRHAVYLGLRDDKAAADVVRDVPDPDAPRQAVHASARPRAVRNTVSAAPTKTSVRTVVAKAPARESEVIGGIRLTHAFRLLWPEFSKRDLAQYWMAVAGHALPELAHRPLALVRCPEGIGGEHFFQKHAKAGMPAELRAGNAGGAPYLALDGVEGLIAAVQISAIELHAWGATEGDPLHPDRLVFDLDPGEGVSIADLAAAARNVRDRLAALTLTSFCRTSGGKGLHVVVPLEPAADWPTVRAFCRQFAEKMEQDEGDRFVASVPKARRRGRILVDWLRNGLGSTAVASFCPRARPGAHVATPLFWSEVTAKLDPGAFDIKTVPERLRRQKSDPWDGIFALRQHLPPQAGTRSVRGRR